MKSRGVMRLIIEMYQPQAEEEVVVYENFLIEQWKRRKTPQYSRQERHPKSMNLNTKSINTLRLDMKSVGLMEDGRGRICSEIEQAQGRSNTANPRFTSEVSS
jgi:hypothetical protein